MGRTRRVLRAKDGRNASTSRRARRRAPAHRSPRRSLLLPGFFLRSTPCKLRARAGDRLTYPLDHGKRPLLSDRALLDRARARGAGAALARRRPRRRGAEPAGILVVPENQGG